MRLFELDSAQKRLANEYKQKLKKVNFMAKKLDSRVEEILAAYQKNQPDADDNQLNQEGIEQLKRFMKFDNPKDIFEIPQGSNLSDPAFRLEYLKKLLTAKYREDIYGSVDADPNNPQDTGGTDQQQSANNTQLNDRMKSQLDGLTPEQKQELLRALQS